MTDATSTPQTCKAVVFSTAGHRFALPLNAISRIIHRALLQSDRTIDGLFYFENQPLDMIDLGQLLQGEAGSSSTPNNFQNSAQFFVLIQRGAQQGGIAADVPPVLMDLPLDLVHEVPAAYRQTLQGLASHMISLETQQDSQGDIDTIFLLDLQQVVTRLTPVSASPMPSDLMPV